MQAVSTHKSIIPKSWNVSQTIRQRVGEAVGSQRLIKEGGEILVLLHRLPSAEDKGDREAAMFWYDGQGSWKSSPTSGGRSELRTLVETYRKCLAELDSALESVEDAAVIHTVIDEATPVARAGRHLTLVISELRRDLPEDLEILAIRDLAVNMERGGDLLLQDAKSSLDFMIAKNAVAQAKDAQKSAKEAQKLNRLAAFFFPLMTIAAVFGMNRPGEILANGGIIVIVILGLVLGAIFRASLKKSE